MSFKDILLHVDDTDACKKRIEAAAVLARAHDAHLTGLHVIPPPFVPTYDAMPVPLDSYAQLEEAYEARAQESEKRFKTMLETSDLRTEWRCEKGSLLNILAEQARYTDLVVVGQRDPDEADRFPEEAVDRLVFECGRPVMFIPYIGAQETIGRRIMIAWNAKKESARAVYDALPLLKAADEVHVMTINPKTGPRDHGEVVGADIGLYLARHEVKANVQKIEKKGISTGNMLLSRASDAGIDLLVMGAYGHSRLRELVLGGATQQILGEMTVPVLMSH